MTQKPFYGSLSRRIFLLIFFLLIIPMSIFSFLIWDRDKKIARDAAQSEMTLLKKANEKIYTSWIRAVSAEVGGFSLLTQNRRDLSLQNGQTLFRVDSSGVFRYSNQREMVGEKVFFERELQEVKEKTPLVFLSFNPFMQRQEVVFLLKMGRGVWGVCSDAEKWKRNFLIPTSGSLTFAVQHEENLQTRIPLPYADFSLYLNVSLEELEKAEGANLFSHFLIFLLVFLVFAGVVVIWLLRKMAWPLRQLSEKMAAVGKGDYSQHYIPDRFGFEINELGEQFTQMQSDLVHQMEEVKKEKLSKELLQSELQIGREIQEGLLPTSLPQFPGFSMGGGYIPAKEVGGDFYDLFPLPDGRLFFVIADGSDKGISACLYALIVRSMLRTIVSVEQELEGMVQQVNHLFLEDTKDTGNFVTAWFALYHPENRKLTYTSAGHEPALFIEKEGAVRELQTEGMALGVEEFVHVEVKSLEWQEGDFLLLFTDGVVEAHSEKGELYGRARLKDFASGNRRLEAQELIDKLLAEALQFSIHAPQHDDITALALKKLSSR